MLWNQHTLSKKPYLIRVATPRSTICGGQHVFFVNLEHTYRVAVCQMVSKLQIISLGVMRRCQYRTFFSELVCPERIDIISSFIRGISTGNITDHSFMNSSSPVAFHLAAA